MTYRFKAGDCATARGVRVIVLQVLSTVGGYWVRALTSGREFFVSEEVLKPDAEEKTG